ncbi:macro domain-containing protein [Planctomicrobium sp. SH668]|uniref:macro domain-containing protein n=1 Tax=Planctomicrobium sp. SH668 TaxID=3448126 RepID=UPI003F5CB78C
MFRRIDQSILELLTGDIVQMKVDAIVNAANTQLIAGGGVDGAIHRTAGSALQEELNKLYPDGCPVGSAVATGGFLMPVKFLFHAVGPVWKGGREGEADLLKSAYQSCLELAINNHCQTIAFPAISTGVYSYPIDRAAHVALSTIMRFLRDSEEPLHVLVVLFQAGQYGAFSRVLEEMMPA